MKLYQQGDVLMFKENSIPKSAKPVPAKEKIVLAEGEVTGHAHAIADLKHCKLFEDNNVKWLQVLAPVKINHEEHKTVTLPKGTYRLGIVREVDPFAEEVKKVQD